MGPCNAFVDQNTDGQTVSRQNGASVFQPSDTPSEVRKIDLPIWDTRYASNEPSIDGTDLFSESRTAKIYQVVGPSTENVSHLAYRRNEQCVVISYLDLA